MIKRAPAAGPLAPYEVQKDVTIYTTLRESDIPVPRLLGWTTDVEVFERPFTVTAFVDGESHDISKVERWPSWQNDRRALGYEIIERLAAIQRFDWRETGLSSVLGPPGPAAARIESTVHRYLDPLLEIAERTGERQPLWRELGQWIIEHAPDVPEEELVLVHGDYRFGNFIWRGSSIVVILDWERATLGPAMQELGFICMPLSRLSDPRLMAKALTFKQLQRKYEAATGRAVDVALVQYYAILWEWIEGTNSTRVMLTPDGHGLVSTTGLIQPNLAARHILRLIDDFEHGRESL